MTPISEKPFMVINKETEISVSFHKTKEEAEAVAREMTEYHDHTTYIAVERTI